MPSCNLARFDLVSIRLAVLCVELGSLSRAARAANMSLSRASHRLTALEAAVGTTLFERNRLGMRATENGRVVALHGRTLLRTIDMMTERLATAEAGPRPQGIDCECAQ